MISLSGRLVTMCKLFGICKHQSFEVTPCQYSALRQRSFIHMSNSILPGSLSIRRPKCSCPYFLRPSFHGPESEGHRHQCPFAGCGGGSKTGDGIFLSYFDPPGAVGGTYGSGCFHPFSSFSVSESRALCCLGSVTWRFASNNDRMYRA